MRSGIREKHQLRFIWKQRGNWLHMMTSRSNPYSPSVVLTSAALTMFLGSSLISASGVFHMALLDHYQQSVTKTAWIGAIFTSVFCLAGPLASGLIQRFSCRACIIVGGVCNLIGCVLSSVINNFYVLFFTFGIGVGVGQCLSYTATFVTVGYNFESTRSVATGFLVSGFALGQIVHPVLVRLLLDTYGLNGTYLLLGAMGFQVCVFACLIIPNRLELEVQMKCKDSTTFKDFFMLCYSLPFCMFCLSILSWSFGLSVTFVYITDFYFHFGSDKLEASLFTSVIGIGSLLSRVLIGLAVGSHNIDGKIVYFGKYALLCICTCTLTLYGHSFYGKLGYSILSGIYTGATWTLLSPITVEIVGVARLAVGFGMEMLVAGIGFLIGPIVGGLIIEKYSSFRFLFIFAGISYGFASIFGVLMSLWVPGVTESGEKDSKCTREIIVQQKDNETIEDTCTVADRLLPCDQELPYEQ